MAKLLYILAETNDFWGSRLPWAMAAKERGAEIHLAAPGAALDPKLKEHGFTGHDLPPVRDGFSVSAGIKNIFAIRKILKDLNPDIVHTITLKYSLLTGLAAGRREKSKLVYTIAGLGYVFSGSDAKSKIFRFIVSPFLQYVLMNKAATITFQNPDDMRILIEDKLVRPEKCVLIRGSGVDLRKFSPRPAPDSQTPLVVLPARLIRDKGISVFIDMAKILKKRQIPARFQVAGSVPDHNPLAISKSEMERMIQGTPVEWIGRVSDMPALYEQATLIVYPSWYREGIPRVLLEAAAMGKAVVTTDHPGCREAVAHNDNGLLVPVRNAEATADAVEQILKNPDLRKKMEEAGRRRAESEFDVRLIAAQTVALYGL